MLSKRCAWCAQGEARLPHCRSTECLRGVPLRRGFSFTPVFTAHKATFPVQICGAAEGLLSGMQSWCLPALLQGSHSVFLGAGSVRKSRLLPAPGLILPGLYCELRLARLRELGVD